MRFSEAIEKYISWRSFTVKSLTNRGDLYDFRVFCLFLRNPEIESVGLEDVLSYLKLSKELGWDQNTMISKVTALRKLFKFFKSQGLKVLDPDLVPVIKYERRMAKVMTEEVHNKLLNSLKTNLESDCRDRALLMMLWDTGARNGEILSLNIENLDLVNKEATIRTEKSRGGVDGRPFRQVLWTEKTNELLKKWLAFRDKDGALFISLSYRDYGLRLSNMSLGGIMRRLCDANGMERYNPHSYRHHMAHDVLEKTGNIVKVAKILGHANAKSSLAYLHLNDQEMKEVYRKVKGD